MELNFKIQGDTLAPCGIYSAVTGNAGAYTCRFELPEEAQDYLWLCIFIQGDKVLQQIIENGCCLIPEDILIDAEAPLYIGCCGTKLGEDFVRISTNRLQLTLIEGAYCVATAPKVPSPDVWEELVLTRLPYIGENDNWYVYDVASEAYIDSGVFARGTAPVRGVDYWTEEDTAAIVSEVSEILSSDLKFSVNENGIVTAIKED